MGIGSLLGGAAEGLQFSQKQALAEKTQSADESLRSRGLDIEEMKAAVTKKGNALSEGHKIVDDLYKSMSDHVEAMKGAGASPDLINQAIEPLATNALETAKLSGMPLGPLQARIDSLVQRPPMADTPDSKNYQFYAQQETAAGRTPQPFADWNAEMKKASATSNSVVMQGEGKFAQSLGEGAAKEVLDQRTKALDAVQSLNANQQALGLLNKGVITGAGADFKKTFGKVLTQIGYHKFDDAVANTEAFVSTRAQEVGRIIKLFGAGTGLSDADREYATKAAAGQIDLNEGSMRKILEINDKASRHILKIYNASASKIDKRVVPFDLGVRDPALDEAQHAIENGAPREAVIERLKALGIDASGL